MSPPAVLAVRLLLAPTGADGSTPAAPPDEAADGADARDGVAGTDEGRATAEGTSRKGTTVVEWARKRMNDDRSADTRRAGADPLVGAVEQAEVGREGPAQRGVGNGGPAPPGVAMGDLRLVARLLVMAGWGIGMKRAPPPMASPGVEQVFFLQLALLRVALNYKNLFFVRSGVELAGSLRPPREDRPSIIGSTFGEVNFLRPLRFRFGFFRRPFSRIELIPPGLLPARRKGLTNERIVRDRNYGDRSVGAVITGDFDAVRVSYAGGVFAPALRQDGFDAIARLEVAPTRWLSIGGNAVLKRIDDGEDKKTYAVGAGGDFGVSIKRFTILGEAIAGQDYLVPTLPWSFGVVAHVTYDIELPSSVVLQPLVLGEWIDLDPETAENETARAVIGLNLIWQKRFRVMPQAEFIRPSGADGTPWVNRDTFSVMLSLNL